MATTTGAKQPKILEGQKNLKRTPRVGNVLDSREFGEHCGSQPSRRETLACLYSTRLRCVAAAHDFKGSLVDVRFDPTGRTGLIAAASVGETTERGGAPNAGETAMIYDIRCGKSRPLDGHGGQTVSEIAFTGDGTRVVSGGYNGTVCVWDVTAPGIFDRQVADDDRDSRGQFAFVPIDVDRIPMASGLMVRVERFQLSPACPGLLAAIIGDASGKRSEVRIANCDRPDEIPITILRGVAFCNELEFAGGGYERTVACAMDEGGAIAVSLREAGTTARGATTRLFGHARAVSSIACCKWSPLFATGDVEGCLRVWDLRAADGAKAVTECWPAGSDFNSCSFSPCEKYLQGATANNGVRVFDLRNPSIPLHVLQHGLSPDFSSGRPFSQGVFMSRWSRSGFLFSCGEDHELRVWDITRGSPLLSALRTHRSPVNCVGISEDETLVVSGCDGKRIALHALSEPADPFENATGSPDRFAGACGPLILSGSQHEEIEQPVTGRS